MKTLIPSFLMASFFLFFSSCSSTQTARYTASDLDSIPLEEIARAPENFFVGDAQKSIFAFNVKKEQEAKDFKASQEKLLSEASTENTRPENMSVAKDLAPAPSSSSAVAALASSSSSNISASNELVRRSEKIQENVEEIKQNVTLEIDKLHEAKDHIKGKDYLLALDILKELYNSPVLQIKTRAKFMTGEILFLQGEFDLSMQIFEELAHYYANSFIVVEVLSKLILCAKKLGLDDKVFAYTNALQPFLAEDV